MNTMAAAQRTPVLIAVLALVTSCSLLGGDEADDADNAPTATTTVPSRIVDDPFCVGMISLRTQALTGDLPDEPDYVNRTYLGLRPHVPAVLRADFEQMLVELGAVDSEPARTEPGVTNDTAGTTDGDGSLADEVIESEGYVPDDTALERVQAYVEANCTGTLNNPGPAATTPP